MTSTPQIVSLPFELIETILMELEWDDVLRVRGTCRTLHDATRSLAVWRNSFAGLSGSYVVPILTPKPLGMYNSQQLETLFLRWMGAESKLWSPSSTLKTPVYRHVRSASSSSTLVLIEGGRWLLTTDKCDQGSIMAHLVDSPGLVSTVLILGSDESYVTNMHAIVDHTSSTLEFDLSLTYDHLEPSSDPTRFEVWRVTETSDGNGLLARRISVVSTRTCTNTIFKSSFLGPWYAHFSYSDVMEVYDWRQSDSEFHFKSAIKANSGARIEIIGIHLTPGNKLLLLGHSSISMIPIPEPTAQLLNGPESISSPPPPLFHLNFRREDLVWNSISPWIGSNENAYASFSTTRGIYFIHVQDNEALVRKMHDRRLHFISSFPLGPHRAAVNVKRGGGNNLMTMSLRREPTVYSYSTCGPCEGVGPRSAIDEWSGRVVMYLKDPDLSITIIEPQ